MKHDEWNDLKSSFDNDDDHERDPRIWLAECYLDNI